MNSYSLANYCYILDNSKRNSIFKICGAEVLSQKDSNPKIYFLHLKLKYLIIYMVKVIEISPTYSYTKLEARSYG